MSQSNDRRVHADAVRRHSRLNQAQRLKRQIVILLVSVALGGIAYPSLLLDRQTVAATSTYLRAKAKLLLVSGAIADAPLQISYGGREYEVSARAVAAHPYYRGSAHATLTLIVRGCWLSFVAWLLGQLLLRGAARRRREWALRDRVIAGTLVVTEKQLARLSGKHAGARALTIGSVPIPSRLETRHMAMIGTTGSGKTTALRQMLDGIEARGEAALVYDTSGEFIAHYYRPERGDIILNPFDARCAYWSPFAEIAHPADADRIAHQLITETGQHDRDVWLETSRILVANMIRALWREGNGTLPALLDALQARTKDDLKIWLGNSSSARTFAEDADRATGSVLFMLAKAANLIQFLRVDDGAPFAFRDFIQGLDKRTGARPWIFVPRKPKTPEQALTTAREYFEDGMAGAMARHKLAKYALGEGLLKDAAFDLHQTTERLYACALLTLTFYTPYNHNIAFLRSLAEGLDRRLYGIWPEGRRRERAMFQKLKEAYTKARYSKHYRISEEELAWLGERVEELGSVVHLVCSERIAALEQATRG